MKIYLSFKCYNKRIYQLINTLNLEHDEDSSMALLINENSLELYDRENLKQKSIKVDFTSKKNNYRCLHFKKKNEVLSRVIGIKKSYFPVILDATAGLGNDAFIFSFLGCQVIMIERHPIVAALLQDGLQRGYKDKKIGFWLKTRLRLLICDSLNMLNIPMLNPDVIYLDPMYPVNKKKSLPKKNMQFFRKLIGNNCNSQNLLNISRKFAKKRVVVKRPFYAKPLSQDQVNFIIKTKNHRFDIYNPFQIK
ncbi:class I SAM-dependent methyltransferase [Buchnera aphidicola]|uniref:Ribosomal RNA small subunit methyltransferase J n=1 Tax=Buchnera aphidicola (Artemisaphis artemisicola) TaxID=1241836 RepID=A0A4D6XLX6_9GAMM|nr:class I SAM-dependent methyltransferase [Buchnera aphidicola]QCI16227.1 16S rRNA methyltransferase [Buchnera aphidicola (Artemisaphis artemisicola)]